MGMDWLKGLVGASDQMVPAGQPYPGAQAWGPPPTYGAQPQAPGAPPQGGYAPPQGGYAPPPGGAPAQPAWSPPAAGGPGAGTPAWGTPSAAALTAAPGSAEARVAALEAECARLRGDVESIALFARTLLTLLQEKKVVTPDEFQETKKKLDMLDGKLDDRMASGS
jgi:hypothetical protein